MGVHIFAAWVGIGYVLGKQSRGEEMGGVFAWRSERKDPKSLTVSVGQELVNCEGNKKIQKGGNATAAVVTSAPLS